MHITFIIMYTMAQGKRLSKNNELENLNEAE